jgi:protein gp37
MGQQSNIDWTDSTWNPIRGCSPVSPGCQNCYAANTAKRFSGPGKPFEGLVRINAAGERTNDWNGHLRFVEAHLLDPLKWGSVPPPESGIERRRRIFVNSVSDLFHEHLDRKHLVSIFAVMALCPEHVFQVLTKRAERLGEVLYHGGCALRTEVAQEVIRLVRQPWNENKRNWHQMIEGRPVNVVVDKDGMHVSPAFLWPLPNVLIGVSVENQEWADKRREHLGMVAAVGWKTFVSYEPALGPVNWDGWEFLNWLISGGESQAGARPSSPLWHHAAKRFCEQNHIPYFFKQWGDWIGTLPTDPKPAKSKKSFEWNGGVSAWLVGRKAAGHLLDGHEYRAFPVMP